MRLYPSLTALELSSFTLGGHQVADLDVIRRRGWELSLGLTVGVAGISKPGTIKCLHTHFAHFLATGQNVVGRWVRDALNDGLHVQRSVRGDGD